MSQTYYHRLLKDLQAEQVMRQSRIDYNKSVLWHGEAVLEYLNNPEKELTPKFINHLYQASQIWPYAPQRTTYDEMLSGNIAQLIPDDELRYRLALYYVSVLAQIAIQNERTPYRGSIRANLPHKVQSYIRKNCRETTEVINLLPASVLAKSCEMNLDAALLSKAYKGLASYPDLRKYLNRHLADIEQKITSLRGFKLRTQVLIEILDRLGQ